MVGSAVEDEAFTGFLLACACRCHRTSVLGQLEPPKLLLLFIVPKLLPLAAVHSAVNKVRFRLS